MPSLSLWPAYRLHSCHSNFPSGLGSNLIPSLCILSVRALRTALSQRTLNRHVAGLTEMPSCSALSCKLIWPLRARGFAVMMAPRDVPPPIPRSGRWLFQRRRSTHGPASHVMRTNDMELAAMTPRDSNFLQYPVARRSTPNRLWDGWDRQYKTRRMPSAAAINTHRCEIACSINSLWG